MKRKAAAGTSNEKKKKKKSSCLCKKSEGLSASCVNVEKTPRVFKYKKGYSKPVASNNKGKSTKLKPTKSELPSLKKNVV